MVIILQILMLCDVSIAATGNLTLTTLKLDFVEVGKVSPTSVSIVTNSNKYD